MEPSRVQRHKGIKVLPSGLTVYGVGGRQQTKEAGKFHDRVLVSCYRPGGKWGAVGGAEDRTWEISQEMFEQKHKGQQGGSQEVIWGQSAPGRGDRPHHGQTLRSNVAGVFHKENGSLDRGERGGDEGREVTGQSMQGLLHGRWTWGFIQSEVGAMEGS